jgi:DNA-binding NarL/FixJ family response regulator
VSSATFSDDSVLDDDAWILRAGARPGHRRQPALAARRPVAADVAALAETVAALSETVSRLEAVVARLAAAEASAPRAVSEPSLSRRQFEILRLLAAGRTTQGIADDLGLTRPTVRNHVARMLRALGAHTRLEAVATARARGWL